MDNALAGRLAQAVRKADPDRYLASLFAPERARPYLHALYAFNHELAHVAESVREPMLGAIRLQWWRETAAEAAKGHPRPHDVASGLAALFGERGLPPDAVEQLIAARRFDAAGETFSDFVALENYLDASGGELMRLAARILGGETQDLREAALAYGLAGLLRSLPFHRLRGKLYLPLALLNDAGITADAFFSAAHDPRVHAIIERTKARAKGHFRQARLIRPGKALPAILPAALVPVYLKRLGRDVPIQRRQIALLSAAIRRRL